MKNEISLDLITNKLGKHVKLIGKLKHYMIESNVNDIDFLKDVNDEIDEGARRMKGFINEIKDLLDKNNEVICDYEE